MDTRATTRIRVCFAVAVFVHLGGLLLARSSYLGPDVGLTDTPPQLPGQTTVVRVAGWAIDEEAAPTPRVDEYNPPPVDVRITPREMRIARQRFVPEPTDVSRPTPAELALVTRLLDAQPSPQADRRETAVAEDMKALGRPAPGPPIPRRMPSLSTPESVAVLPASAPREQSVGRNVETLPVLLDNRPPLYPAQAVAARQEGTVTLRLEIAPSGSVAKVEVLSSSGHAVLDAEAVRAVRSWRFVPATERGLPVAAAVRLPVRFTLE